MASWASDTFSVSLFVGPGKPLVGPEPGRVATTRSSTTRAMGDKRGAPYSVLPGVRNDGQQDRLDRPRRRADARAVGVFAQTSQPAPGVASASAVPRTGAGAGSNAARSRHRGTRNRQRARSTAEHARGARATPRH